MCVCVCACLHCACACGDLPVCVCLYCACACGDLHVCVCLYCACACGDLHVCVCLYCACACGDLPVCVCLYCACACGDLHVCVCVCVCLYCACACGDLRACLRFNRSLSTALWDLEVPFLGSTRFHQPRACAESGSLSGPLLGSCTTAFDTASGQHQQHAAISAELSHQGSPINIAAESASSHLSAPQMKDFHLNTTRII